jgi:hypothetical protein
MALLAAMVVGCSAAPPDPFSPGAPVGDSLVANLTGGPWRATHSLEVRAVNGDLVIDGQDPDGRRLLITLFGRAGAIADGESVTLSLGEDAAGSIGVAILSTGGGAAAWASSRPGSTGTITLLRTGTRATGTFSLILGPVAGTTASAYHAANNGRFAITLP